MDLKSFFDVTKLPTKILFVIACVSGFYLFAPADFITRLHLERFQKYDEYVGLAFLFSSVLVAVNFVIWLFNKISRWFKNRSIRADYKRMVKDLDPQEQSVLREFFICGQSSINMPIDNAVVSGLLQKRILRMNSQINGQSIGTGLNFPLSMAAYVDKIIQLNDIGIPDNVTDAEKNKLLSSRPEWINSRWRW